MRPMRLRATLPSSARTLSFPSFILHWTTTVAPCFGSSRFLPGGTRPPLMLCWSTRTCFFPHPRYPENTTTEATKVLVRQGWDASKLSRWGDKTEVVREALAWCASHARAASVAEKALVHELEAEDAQVRSQAMVKLPMVARFACFRTNTDRTRDSDLAPQQQAVILAGPDLLLQSPPPPTTTAAATYAAANSPPPFRRGRGSDGDGGWGDGHCPSTVKRSVHCTKSSCCKLTCARR